MPLSFIFPKGKKAFLNSIYSSLVNLFIPYKPLIVLEACTPFHLEHFRNIIYQLSLSDQYYIAVITPDNKGMSPLKNVSFYKTINDYPLYKMADVFISTEYNKIPFWFSCPSIYFGHGIGPKLDYVVNEGLLDYDFIFSPYRPAYELQTQALSKEKVIPVGLPILDNSSSRQQEIIDNYQLDACKPIIVYAPSWCNNISKVSDVKAIIAFLSTKKQFNIIMSPHPLLFEPNRCDGQVFFQKNSTFTDMHINLPKSKFTTLDLVKASDMVISDISSILFEAMALNKKVLFDGNKAIYEYSKALHIHEEVIQVCHTPCWDDLEDKTIENVIEFDDLHSQRERFINNYLFNNGNASTHFIQEVENILKRDS
jgi:hypothetical protein